MAREMKDSGIEWIGDIPSEWYLPKIKNLFTIGRGRVISQLELEDSGYPVYSSQTKNDGCLGYISTYDYDRSQLTWTTDGANAGTVFLREGKHNCTNVCGTLMPKNDNNNLKYLKYALEYIAVYHKRADINGYKIMNNEMADIVITLPPKCEQQKIADYLDRKCTEIDAVIEKTKATIEEYKKLKQSVITEAVTKGIRGNRPMKDSGIEWIGDIPADWNVVRIKNLFDYRNERNFKPLEEVNLISLYTDLGVVQHCDLEETTGNKASNADGYKLVYEDDIVVNIILCWMGAIGRSAYNGVTSPAYDVYSPKEGTNTKFYHHLFRTQGFNGDCYKVGRGIMAMRWRTYSDQFRAIKVVSPPPEEQEEIVKYLDKKCTEIDTLIAKKTTLLEEMENYKKSVIYEYVTGKKEVM